MCNVYLRYIYFFRKWGKHVARISWLPNMLLHASRYYTSTVNVVWFHSCPKVNIERHIYYTCRIHSNNYLVTVTTLSWSKIDSQDLCAIQALNMLFFVFQVLECDCYVVYTTSMRLHIKDIHSDSYFDFVMNVKNTLRHVT